MNTVVFSGELATPATVRQVGDKQVANATLLFNVKERVESIKISAWGNAALELQKYQQGAFVIVEGRCKPVLTDMGAYKERTIELEATRISIYGQQQV